MPRLQLWCGLGTMSIATMLTVPPNTTSGTEHTTKYDSGF
jgi:hypothetical protein